MICVDSSVAMRPEIIQSMCEARDRIIALIEIGKIEARVQDRKRSEKIAGLSVWEATPELVAQLKPHQRGHLRRAAKILARDPWKDHVLRGLLVADMCLR